MAEETVDEETGEVVEVVETIEETIEETTDVVETSSNDNTAVKPVFELPKELENVARAYYAKLLPSWVRNVEQAVVIAQYAKELGLEVGISAFKILYLVNNVPTLTAVGLGALIKSKGHNFKIRKYAEPFKNLKGEPDLVTEIAFYTKGDPEPDIITYTWGDARAAGLVNKGPWKQYPKDMLFNRCLSRGARIVFPHIIQGFYLAEEIASGLNTEVGTEALLPEEALTDALT